MSFTLTNNLKLRVDANLTAAAKSNLQKLDALGAIYVIDETGTVSIRNASTINLRPNDASVGGSGVGGILNAGVEAQPLDALNVFAEELALEIETLSLPDSVVFEGNFQLPWDNVSKSGASVLDISDFDAEVSNNTSVVLNTSHRSTSSGVHGLVGSVVGTTDAQVLTTKNISALSNTITDLSNSSIASGAAIAYHKLNLASSILASDLAPSFELDGSLVDFSSISVADLGNHSHSQLTDIGTNSHTAIDAHLASTSAHGVIGNVVGTASVQVLTQKTIDAAQNTISGLMDNSIASNAAISGSKISPNFGAQTVETSGSYRIHGPSFWSEIDAASGGQASNLSFRLPNTLGSSGQVLAVDGSGNMMWATPIGTGTVTSIGLSAPTEFTVADSPVTTAGTISLSWNPQSANELLAGPTNGADATPAFRLLVADDIPSLTAAKISDFNNAFSLQLATKSTGDLAEGANLYYTTERAQDAIGAALLDTDDINLTYDDAAPSFSAALLSSAITSKTDVSAAAADYVLISDSSDSGNLKKTLLSSVAALSGGSYAEDWTTGDSKSVMHNLSSTDVLVQLYDIDSGETIYVDSVIRQSTSTVALSSSEAPTGSGWRVLIKRI